MEQPLEFLQSQINHPVWIISRHEAEYSGIFEGFDEGLNVVLSDMTVHSPEGKKTEYSKILLRRDQIDLIIPNADLTSS